MNRVKELEDIEFLERTINSVHYRTVAGLLEEDRMGEVQLWGAKLDRAMRDVGKYIEWVKASIRIELENKQND